MAREWSSRPCGFRLWKEIALRNCSYQFDSVTRAVVVATLLSAFVQGLLAGIGYYLAGVSSVFLLTALSMLLTLVPFVGAAMVWVPVCLWLYAVEGRVVAAVLLAPYCVAVVSMVNNLDQAVGAARPLEPPSAVGPVERARRRAGHGPIGIFVGPMARRLPANAVEHGARRTEQHDQGGCSVGMRRLAASRINQSANEKGGRNPTALANHESC